MAGGMNVTRADGSRVSQPGGMSAQESKEVFWVSKAPRSVINLRNTCDLPLNSSRAS